MRYCKERSNPRLEKQLCIDSRGFVILIRQGMTDKIRHKFIILNGVKNYSLELSEKSDAMLVGINSRSAYVKLIRYAQDDKKTE